MTCRRKEIEILATTLGGAACSLLRQACDALDRGDLDGAGRLVAVRVARYPALEWTALLLALEAFELQLAGGTEIEAPRSRFKSGQGVALEEWGPFRFKVALDEKQVWCQIVRAQPGARVPWELWTSVTDEPRSREAIAVLLWALEAFFGFSITLVAKQRSTGAA